MASQYFSPVYLLVIIASFDEFYNYDNDGECSFSYLSPYLEVLQLCSIVAVTFTTSTVYLWCWILFSSVPTSCIMWRDSLGYIFYIRVCLSVGYVPAQEKSVCLKWIFCEQRSELMFKSYVHRDCSCWFSCGAKGVALSLPSFFWDWIFCIISALIFNEKQWINCKISVCRRKYT